MFEWLKRKFNKNKIQRLQLTPLNQNTLDLENQILSPKSLTFGTPPMPLPIRACSSLIETPLDQRREHKRIGNQNKENQNMENQRKEKQEHEEQRKDNLNKEKQRLENQAIEHEREIKKRNEQQIESNNKDSDSENENLKRNSRFTSFRESTNSNQSDESNSSKDTILYMMKSHREKTNYKNEFQKKIIKPNASNASDVSDMSGSSLELPKRRRRLRSTERNNSHLSVPGTINC